MEKTIIIESEQQQTDYRLRCAVREVQDSYTRLKKALRLDSLPPLEEINGQWLAEWIDERVQAVSNTFPLESAKEINKQWMSTKRLTAKYVGAIMRNLQAWPDAQWLYDERIDNYYITNVDEIVDKLCTRIVPEEAETHLQLCAKVFQAVQELREWEQKQDVNKLPLERLAKMDDYDFAEVWATGRIKIDHEQDTEALKAWREINQQRYL